MVVNFSFRNFRSIKDEVTLSFEASNSSDLEDYYIIQPKEGVRLLKMGLIFGANASGKTNILRALDFLRKLVLNPFDKKTEVFQFQGFLFDPETKEEDTSFSLEFYQNGIRYIYEVMLNRNRVASENLYFYNPNKALVFKRETERNKQLTSISFGSKIKISQEHKASLEANTLWNNSVLGGYLKTNIASRELQEVIDWFQEKLKGLITPKTELLPFISDKLEQKEINKSHIVELLQKADFKISDILMEDEEVVVDPNFIEYVAKNNIFSESKIQKIKESGKIESREIFFKHLVKSGNAVDSYQLSYGEESQGTQRYYQFSGILDLMIKKEIIFPIDELESSLHPDLLKHFILTFLVNSKKSQLIATTHYRELLQEKDILRNDIIWFAEKQENGSTDLYSLIDFDSSVVRNTSSIFNAYKIGKLGAVPELSDYYFNPDNEEK